MQLIPFNPFRELDRLSGELDQFLGNGDYSWTPAVDIVETKDAMLITAELPGLTRKDVHLNIENNVLTISGERQFKDEYKKGNVTRRESYYGKFQRSFRLPNILEVSKAQAKMENGVLEITMPKREEAKPKEISIEVH